MAKGIALYDISEGFRRLVAALEDGGDTPQQLEAMVAALDALGLSLDTKAANIAAFILNLEAEAEAVEKAEKRMQARKKSLTGRASWLRTYLLTHLRACNKTEVTAADKSFVVRVAKNPQSVKVNSIDELPPEYVEKKTEESPKKDDIKRALKAGIAVPGAEWAPDSYRLNIG